MYKIDNIETVLDVFSHVFYCKIEPLTVANSIGVRLHEQVVLVE